MHLVIPFTLLMGSFVAAAPSIQHAQISVEVTHTDVENQAYALHSSEELVMNHGGSGYKNLPFNFTLNASLHSWGEKKRLPLGFENLTHEDGWIRARLGFPTVFAFHNGTLITGNRALGHTIDKFLSPWATLWSLKIEQPDLFFDLIAVSRESLQGGLRYFIEFVEHDKIFGAMEIQRGAEVYVGPLHYEIRKKRLLLEVEPIQKSSEDINAKSEERLL